MRKFGAAILAGLLVAAVPAAAQHSGGGFSHGGGFHGGGFHGGGFHQRFRPFFLGGGFFPVVPYGYAEPFYGYAPPSAWYCANPPGYYPYVPQCAVQWQAVPVPQ